MHSPNSSDSSDATNADSPLPPPRPLGTISPNDHEPARPQYHPTSAPQQQQHLTIQQLPFQPAPLPDEPQNQHHPPQIPIHEPRPLEQEIQIQQQPPSPSYTQRQPNSPMTQEKQTKSLEERLKDEEENEALQIMEAKAGHEMVQKIARDDGQPIKIAYMTNRQAAAVAQDRNSLLLMKDALCGKEERSLIIDLVHSWGFTKSTQLMDKVQFENKFCAGIKHNSRPFKNFDDEARTLDRLDHFMKTVIIPLAEETRAIVICNAMLGDCALSDSFAKTVEQNIAMWDGDPPFAMVGACSQVDVLYHNTDADVSWRKMQKQCDRWNVRHDLFLEEYFSKKRGQGGAKETNSLKRGHDINANHKRILIVEGLNMNLIREEMCETNKAHTSYNPKNRAAFSSLMTALIREIGNNASSLAIKTGATGRDGLAIKIPKGVDPMSLHILAQRLNESAKVLCLDIRNRDKQHLIFDEDSEAEAVSKQKIKARDATRKADPKKETDIFFDYIEKEIKENCELKYESLDISTLAYLKNLLNLLSRRMEQKSRAKSQTRENDYKIDTLRYEITDRKFDAEEGAKEEVGLTIDYGKYAYMFAKVFYQNVLDKSKEKTYYKKYKGSMDMAEADLLAGIFCNEIMHTANLVRQLLMTPTFYSANIWEKGIKKTINDIVLWKTSETATRQGLMTLRDALDNADETHLAADFYKKFSNRLYAIQLILGLLITVFSVTSANWAGTEFEKDLFKRLTLICSLFLAGFVSIDTLFTPRLNWRQLRQYAVELDSTIWKYRMRVGEFEVDDKNRNRDRPEINLKEGLCDWKNRLTKKTSSIARTRYTGTTNYGIKKREFRSFNRKKIVNAEGKEVGFDDHFSTLTGQEYMNYRISALISLYQGKVSKHELWQYFPQLLIILLGVIIAFVSELELPAFVTLLIALTTSLQLWIEFRGTLERGPLYSDAISACEVEKTRWQGLDDFTKQKKDARHHLVMETEKIVTQVISSWSTSLERKESAIPTARKAIEGRQEILSSSRERMGTPTGDNAV